MKVINAINQLQKRGFTVTDNAGVLFTATKGGQAIEFHKLNDEGDASQFEVGGAIYRTLKAALAAANTKG